MDKCQLVNISNSVQKTLSIFTLKHLLIGQLKALNKTLNVFYKFQMIVAHLQTKNLVHHSLVLGAIPTYEYCDIFLLHHPQLMRMGIRV